MPDADWKRHVDIGSVALARGLLSVRSLAEAMIEVGLTSSASEDDVWLAPGRLDRRALELVRAALARTADTAVRAAPPRRNTVAPPDAEGGERYVHVRALGRGGMGEVAEHLDTRLQRRVALKSVRPDVEDVDGATEMLIREARVTGSLEHPGIVPVYDMGEAPDGTPFYAMRVVDQASLANVIDGLASGDPDVMVDWGLVRLARVFSQICQAVGYAHSRGVAHRDLKPDNVLLGSFGEVLVVDWGVATPLGEVPRVFAGTMGFIAPELVAEARPIDARSDVFSLGAVLYEILCAKPAFAHASPGDLTRAALDPSVGFTVVPPSGREPPWDVPAELEAVCLRALSIDPAARYRDGSELGEAVDDFLEGTKERERRRRHAEELCESADLLVASYGELSAERPRRLTELLRLRDAVAPWDAASDKAALWDAEDGFAVMDALAMRTLETAVSTYEQALDEVPAHGPARDALARLYSASLRRAHDRRDNFDRVHFEERLRHVTSGGADSLDATLILEVDVASVEVEALLLEERGRKLTPGDRRALGTTPLGEVRLPAGSYALRLRAPGLVAMDVPVLLRVGARTHLALELDGATDLGPGEVLVPGGLALLGGDDETDDLREAHVRSFVIGERPVTFAEYLDFVADVLAQRPSLADSYVPRADDGVPYFAWTGSHFRADAALRWGEHAAALLELPVVGVDAWSAEAYAQWRSRRDGRRYHLPSEDEWEKAARGVDGRRYPWGDRFDPSFCKMRESRPGAPLPEATGSFPADVSPYGVRDMAGGVADWVVTRADDGRRDDDDRERRMVTRGGAWCDARVDCRLTSRRPGFAHERGSRVGFRLARTLSRSSPRSAR